ncbi:type I polyketide synthase [Saccharothrix texasensis]|uniref:Polyketide-type polyunsaturated fatty acid synthase PfaA n=1 Tax=Saccharothrix texasensis TaxID=103734 RepID=A0A3N1H041_9PSEU|nr:type I polyketide synthase [Saccharothrix texasensis]ROP35746.1 polyketide-type polyunsaturated fatty acid synthase PfaA [Saccharothrix texasensis]
MTEQRTGSQVPIAVVGLGALLPGAAGVDRFWRCLVEGRDQLTDVPPDRWLPDDHYDPDPSAPDKTYAKRGAFLSPVDFDPVAYAVPPNQLPATDSAQLLGLLVADQALRDVGPPLSADVRERTSVVVGSSTLPLLPQMSHRLERPVWLKALRDNGVPEDVARRVCERITDHYVPWQEATFPGLLANVVAGRIANRFDLHGTNHTTDAACASSLSAVSVALAELALGRADLALAGGVDTQNGIEMFLCFSKTPALSPSGDCRPFSAAADGTMLGEGAVLLALKRLTDAERDGDRIYAVIRGVGTSSDGRGTAIYTPVPEGQVRALRRAYAEAGYGPGSVGLVEAHGTGTKAGDRAEFTALREVFGDVAGTGRQWCALGSVKSQIGHTKCTAGAAGLLKAILALHHKVLPPTIKVDRPNAELDLPSSPFYLNTRVRPWVRAEGTPRRAAVSSFGFGGSNFHVTIEEYVPANGGAAPGVHRAAPTELLLFSADDPRDLTTRVREAARSWAAAGEGDLPRRARDSQRDFDAGHTARLAVVTAAGGDTAAELLRVADAVDRDPHRPFSLPGGAHYGLGRTGTGGVAFLFPGQGSQYLAMGADLAVHEPCARQAWDRAAGLRLGGEPLHGVVFPPPVFDEQDETAQRERLTATEWAQPALAVHSLALLGVLERLGLRADAVAGHSFGELVALHHAGVFDADTLVGLARRRGELMSESALRAPGAMTAISATAEEVESAIAERGAGRTLVVANYNAPRQVVVSGERTACAELERVLGERGVVTRRLDASAAFHSPLMSGVAVPFGEFVSNIAVGTPVIPVYGNADAAVYPSDPGDIRRRVAEHLLAPVRFAEQVEAMYAAGARTFVEVGAGSVLTGLVGRVLAGRDHLAVPLDHRDRHGVTALQDGLGRLAVRGVALRFDALWEPFALSAADDNDDKRRKPTMTVPIDGGNHGRRYPTADDRTLPPPAPAGNDGVRQADRDGQRHVSEAHAEYLRVLTEAHLAFLRASGEPAASVPEVPPPPPADHVTVPAPERPVEKPPEEHAPGPIEPDGTAARTDEVTRLVVSTVALLTGYPEEVLEPGMQLEGDLGIDSIKRVEIFSALRERLPASVERGSANLGRLRTLGDVIDAVGGGAPGTGGEEVEQAGKAPAPEGGSSTVGEHAPRLRRLAVRARAVPAGGLALPGLSDGPLVVTDEGSGVAAEVVDLLAGHGVRAAVVGEVPPTARGVVFLGGLTAVDRPEQAHAVLHRAFRAARSVAGAFTERGGVFVTVQDTGGDFGLSGRCGPRAWLGGIAALARTAAHEWPAAVVKAVDCHQGGRTPRQVAEAVVGELLGGDTTTDVGLGPTGTRVVLRVVPAEAGSDPGDRLGPGAVLLVSGGARGVTAVALRALAAAHRPRLVLLGRTPLEDEPEGLADAVDEVALVRALAARGGSTPARIGDRARRVLAARDVRRTLAELAAAGSPVRYLAVDVRDPDALREALHDVRARWGPITGLVHAAGVLDDRRIEDKTEERLDAVLDTKLAGLRTLLDATRGDPLSLVCLFSSTSGVFGNAGQCDYAMANCALDTVASVVRAEHPDRLVRSVAWGPWRGGMVTRERARRFTDAGVPLIDPAVGAAAFVAELSTPVHADSRVVLAAGDVRAPATRLRAEVRVSRRTHPHLADHVPLDVPVVPLVVTLDWFVRAVRAWRPGTGTVALEDVRVLGTASLPRFDGPGERFTLAGEETGRGLRVELRGESGRTLCRAVLADPRAPGPSDQPAGLLPVDEPLVYRRPSFFHGPAFRTVERTRWKGPAGLVADITGLRERGWDGVDWPTDPAATDAAFQAALLWAQAVSAHDVPDLSMLPMSVAAYRLHRLGPLPAPGRCVVRAGGTREDVARCDVILLDPDGACRVELLGVELVRRPR